MLIQPQDTSFSTFFDLLTGYRVSQLLLTIRETGVMEIVGLDGETKSNICQTLGMAEAGAGRFIEVLCELGFLHCYDQFICLSPFSRKFLHPSSPHAQLRTLEFEEKLQANWKTLPEALVQNTRVPATPKTQEETDRHLRLFLDAMNEAALLRSEELWEVVPVGDHGTILEVGAGSGAYLAAFLERHLGWQGIFCDLPEVVAVAEQAPRFLALKDRIQFSACDLLGESFDTSLFEQVGADLLLVSNLIHCQDSDATGMLLRRAISCLHDTGVVLIHDFFHDDCWQGALYDFHMLVNTYSGRTYRQSEVASMLKALGFLFNTTFSLPSHSAILVAGRHVDQLPELDRYLPLKRIAIGLGFSQTTMIESRAVPVQTWVREKCKTGCPNYGKGATCPPNSPNPESMKTLLAEFSTAMVLVGEPPLRTFQKNLVELERAAFLQGYPKALAFTGGPCSICDECSPGSCRFPEKRRFSLESCGVDVFGLAKQIGINLKPLQSKTDYVQYIGMLLVE